MIFRLNEKEKELLDNQKGLRSKEEEESKKGKTFSAVLVLLEVV